MRGSMIENHELQLHPYRPRQGAAPAPHHPEHALRPAMLPVVSYLGPAFVASSPAPWSSRPSSACRDWPAVRQRCLNRDYSMVLGLTILVGALTITFNAVVDILYAVIDPKIRY